MGYVTVDFYKNNYNGNSIPDEDLQSELDKASMAVDRLTRMKIKKLGGFGRLSEFEQHQVQMAVCSQADHTYTKASTKGLSSYSVGDISVSFGESSSYDSECVSCLNSTRLMYRGL